MIRKPLLTALGAGLAIVLLSHPALAQSVNFQDVEDAGNELINWMRSGLATVVLTLAIIVTGFLAAFNRIPWMWFWAVFFGAFLIFSSATLVEWLKAIFTN